MKDLSEEAIRKNCPHCDLKSQAYEYVLEQSKNFIVVADGHPLVEGHLLIIPKAHLSCTGEYAEELWPEFLAMYKKAVDFVEKTYGNANTFEHGKIGQTVFHSHMHILPFKGKIEDVIPEGEKEIKSIINLHELKAEYEKEGKYLFFSIGYNMYLVNTKLGAPRFFRDRYAIALQKHERGNWKTVHNDPQLMAIIEDENKRVKEKWEQFSNSY